MSVSLQDGARSASLPADESITLAPGQVMVTTLHVRFARVRFRVTGTDGKPRSGVPLHVNRVGRENSRWLPPTDVRGETAGMVPAGAVEVWVPKRRKAVRGPVVRVGLGTFEFAMGDRRGVIPVSLPAKAGY